MAGHKVRLQDLRRGSHPAPLPAAATLESLALGESWTCPDCGTAWTCAEKEDWCSECGQATGTRKGWDFVPSDELDTAPRFDPQPFTPFRNPFPRSAARHDPPGPFGECYQMPSGPMALRPGCRCKP